MRNGRLQTNCKRSVVGDLAAQEARENDQGQDQEDHDQDERDGSHGRSIPWYTLLHAMKEAVKHSSRPLTHAASKYDREAR